VLFALCLPGRPLVAQDFPNPFAEIEAIEAKVDQGDPAAWRGLMQMARHLGLHGTARRYARELLKSEPDDATARALLSHKKFRDQATGKAVWLDWFDAAMWQSYQQVRDETLGYHLASDRDSIRQGLLRTRQGTLMPVDEWDRSHAEWSKANEIDSRFYHFRSTIPLAALWFVADDLDRLTLAYLDYFEIERLPAKRFTVHLYRTADDAKAAKANADWLRDYGAYYFPQDRILHVAFDRLGGLTAVRHEAAHAMNREFVAEIPQQWFDEGVGVLCQFAKPQPDRSFEFGLFPKHGFGTRYLDELRGGSRDRMGAIHSAGYVTMNSHYYSKFRSMVDFFMNADDKLYRMTFINTFFRRKGDVAQLVGLPGIDDAWTSYAMNLNPANDWKWEPFPAERTDLIRQVLKTGTSAAAFRSRSPETN
jgi:hypothetical protein